jgi:hypothetical protein
MTTAAAATIKRDGQTYRLVRCDHCTDGHRTGPNGEHQRCYKCAGIGQYYKPITAAETSR